MNTLELITDTALYGGTIPKDRMDECRKFLQDLKNKEIMINSEYVIYDDTQKAYFCGFGEDLENVNWNSNIGLAKKLEYRIAKSSMRLIRAICPESMLLDKST